MTFSGAPDGGDGPFQVATGNGWAAFHDAVHASSLEYSKLRELVDSGRVQGTAALAEELDNLLTNESLSIGPLSTARGLQRLVGVGHEDELVEVTH